MMVRTPSIPKSRSARGEHCALSLSLNRTNPLGRRGFSTTNRQLVLSCCRISAVILMGCSIVRFRFAPLTIALSGAEGHGPYFTNLNLQISYLWYPTFDGTWAHHAPSPVYVSFCRFFYEYNTLYPATVPVVGQGPGFCLRKNFHL